VADFTERTILTVAECAELLRCSEPHVRKAAAGKLKGCQPSTARQDGRPDAVQPRVCSAMVRGKTSKQRVA
jgi:hypothetical protein